MNKGTLRGLFHRFKALIQAFLRDVLIFLLFFSVYTGVKEGFSGIRRAKTFIHEFWNEKDRNPEEKEFRSRPRTRKEISRLV